MNFEIEYHELVVKKDIPRLAHSAQQQIRKAIEKRLMVAPEQFGKPLRRSLKGYRKLRVGNYRVIFRIEERRVKIFVIQHRSTVYKSSEQRLAN